MSPGGGLRSCAPWLVLATAVCAAALRDEPTTGNVGKESRICGFEYTGEYGVDN